MKAEEMMKELRRIVGVFMEARNATLESEAGRRNEKAAAYALGRSEAWSRMIDELSLTFKLDPWECEEEIRAARSAK